MRACMPACMRACDCGRVWACVHAARVVVRVRLPYAACVRVLRVLRVLRMLRVVCWRGRGCACVCEFYQSANVLTRGGGG